MDINMQKISAKAANEHIKSTSSKYLFAWDNGNESEDDKDSEKHNSHLLSRIIWVFVFGIFFMVIGYLLYKRGKDEARRREIERRLKNN